MQLLKNIYDHHKFVYFITIILTLAGFTFYNLIPIGLYPQVEQARINLSIYSEDDPTQFFENHGQYIENSLGELSGVTQVEGKYTRDRVRWTVLFDWGVSYEKAKREVSSVAAMYQAKMPRHWKPAKVTIYQPGSENYIAFFPDIGGKDSFVEKVSNGLLPRLIANPYINDAWVSDANQKYFHIEIDPYKILTFNLNLSDVLKSVRRTEFAQRLGTVTDGRQSQLNIELGSSSTNLDDIRQIKVGAYNGNLLYLSDIAKIGLKQNVQNRAFSIDGKEAVALAAWPEPGVPLHAATKEFKRIVDEFTAGKISYQSINDPNAFIEQTLMSVFVTLIAGILISGLAVLIFYRSLSKTLIVVTTIPISLCLSSFVLIANDVSLNLLSMGAMSITIGVVIDGAMIVIETISRAQPVNGQDKKSLFISATRKTLPSLIASTMTSVAVFLPLIFSNPMISSLLTDMCLVAISILLASLFITLFFVPLLVVQLGSQTNVISQRKNKVRVIWLEKLLNLLIGKKYISTLVLLTSVAFLIIGSFSVTKDIRQEIIGEPLAEIIDVEFSFLEDGFSNVRKKEIAQEITKLLNDQYDSKLKFIFVDIRTDVIYFSLHLKSYMDFNSIINSLPERVKSTNEYDVTFSPWVTTALSYNSLPDYTLYVGSNSDEKSRKAVSELTKEIKSLYPQARVKGFPSQRKAKNIRLNFEDNQLFQFISGTEKELSSDKLTEYLQYSLDPKEISKLYSEEGVFPIKLSLQRPLSITEVPVRINEHDIYLSKLTTQHKEKVNSEIYTTNGKKVYKVEVIGDGIIYSELRELIDKISSMDSNSGQTFTIEETGKVLDKSKYSLITCIAISVLLVLGVLLFHFNSFRDCLAVSLTILFSLSGSVLLLYFLDSSISLNSFLGSLFAVGLSVNNTIFLIDKYKELAQSSHNKVKNIIEALISRIRPIAITTTTSVAGMLPIIVGFGPGQEIVRPLGIGTVGGLVVSTILSLIVLPPIILLLSNAKNKEDFLDVKSRQHSESYT